MTMMDSMTPLQRAIASDAEMRRMRDAIAADDPRTMVVDGLGNPAGQRPGACYLRTIPHTVDHAVQVTADVMRREARDDYIRELTDAWRGDHNHREVPRKHFTGDATRDAFLDQVDDLQTAWSRGSGRR